MEHIAKLKSATSTTNSKNLLNLKVKSDVKEQIKKILARINQKGFGRRVTVNDLVKHLLSRLTPDDVRLIREATLSNLDRLEFKYHAYLAKRGWVTMDEFIGLLLTGSIKP